MEKWRFSGRHIKIVYISLFILLMTGMVYTQSGGYAGSYLSLNNSTRAFGMGGVAIACTEDASAIFVNPGMIGMLYDGHFNATLAKMGYDRNYYDMAFSYPLNSWGSIGLAWAQLSVDNIEGRDQDGYVTQNFSDLQSALMLGYSKMIGDNFSLGLTGKYLYHSLAGYSAKGVSIDIGSSIYIGDRITLGAVFRNLNSSLKWNTSSKLKETIPTQIGVGISYFDLFNVPNLLVATDLHVQGGDFLGYQAGVEYIIRDMVLFRGGFSDRGISYGAGLQVAGFKLDIAITPENFGNISRTFFTLSWRFGKQSEEPYEPSEIPAVLPSPVQEAAPVPVSTETKNIVLIIDGPLANERAEVISQNPNDKTITVRLLALPGSDPITMTMDQVRFLE
ncbi:MAG: PorV/PorQ family protein [Candidatus Marinimicrobia bacterium]|nr:PorV/PorQ family protein [Candidatus Neomarinimicrobiota bacterium]